MKNRTPYAYIDFILIAILSILYFGIVIVSLFGFNNPNFVFIQKVKWIEVVSLIIFLTTIFIGSRSLKWYTIFLIFNILALPSSIDNFLPSILISSTNDISKVYFPMITHVDIYLIFGLLKYWVRKKNSDFFFNIANKHLNLLWIGLGLILISLFVNVLRYFDVYNLGLIFSNSFHIRYTILFLLLIANTSVVNYKNEILWSILVSIIFLFMESVLYSYVFYDRLRLVSGSLRNNTFANILAALSCFYIYLILRKLISKNYIFLVFATFIAILFTKTRSAFFLILLYFVLEFFVYLRSLFFKKRMKRFFYAAFVFLCISITSFVILKQNKRFAFMDFKIEKIDFSGKHLKDIIVLERTNFNGSLILRLDHFQTSINMIQQHPFFGIGSGRWNVYKGNFGSNDKSIMDSHNDFLALTSQYGIVPGFLFWFCIFFLPFLMILKKKNLMKPVDFLYIVSGVMLFAGITNAGLFKHQVFGLLMFILILSIYNTSERSFLISQS